MPMIYRIWCGSCSFRVPAIQYGEVYVTQDDGSELLCGHPGEEAAAEEATGMSWKELRRTDRIVFRRDMLCLSCGNRDHYRQIRRGVLSPNRCTACQAERLVGVDEMPGCLLSIAGLLVPRRPNLPCPRCKRGRLREEVCAIS